MHVSILVNVAMMISELDSIIKGLNE